MSIAVILFLLIILRSVSIRLNRREISRDHSGLQQINLVAFKGIARASHPTKEVVSAVARVVTKIPTHAQYQLVHRGMKIWCNEREQLLP